jgi:hypothetical protein
VAEHVSPDEAAALALMPHVKQIMDTLRPMLPDGTDFGVFVLVPGKREGRVIAINTNRDIMAPAIAQWVLGTLGRGK